MVSRNRMNRGYVKTYNRLVKYFTFLNLISDCLGKSNKYGDPIRSKEQPLLGNC
jgi:hypothetical protein